MACIDIYSEDGALLSMPLLIEQIWITGTSRGLHATEVYDFVLCAEEDSVSRVCVLLPHFCRKQLYDGTWADTVALSVVGGPETGWGWMYKNIQATDTEIRADLPSPFARSNHEIVAEKRPQASIAWHSELSADDRLNVMRSIRKSVYVLDLASPLKGAGHDKCWVRLIVQPTEFDLAPHVGRTRGPSALFRTKCSTNAYVTCPVLVRQKTSDRLDRLSWDHPSSAVDAVRDIIVTKGFRHPAANLRVEDHRIFLTGYSGLTVQPMQVPDSLEFLGAQEINANWDHAEDIPNIDWPYTDLSAQAYFYCGGSRTQPIRDLVTMANVIVRETQLGPKPAERIAATITSHYYREGRFLLRAMEQLEILARKDPNRADSPLVPGSQSAAELNQKVLKLRRFYADPSNFETFPEAQDVFRDLHPFRIDFTASWGNMRWWMISLIWTLAFAGVVALLWQVLAVVLPLLSANGQSTTQPTP